MLQLFQCSAQLIGTRGTLDTTADAVQSWYHVIYMLASHQLADALQVTITATQEEYLLDNIVLVCCDVN